MLKRLVMSLSLAAGSSIIAIAPALGHANRVDLSPADGSTVEMVDRVVFTANEELLDLGDGAGFVFSVTDAAGHFYGDGCVSVDGRDAAMTVELGPAGDYVVAYRVVSADGHPIDGSWTFTYAPADGKITGTAYAELPVCGATPIPVAEPTESAAPEPSGVPGVSEPTEFDVTPFIGLVTIPLVLGGIWILARSLGSRDSEDHLN